MNDEKSRYKLLLTFKKSTENRYPPRVQETTEPGSGNVLYFA